MTTWHNENVHPQGLFPRAQIGFRRDWSLAKTTEKTFKLPTCKPAENPMNQLHLRGLDPSSLLGFLATLGVLVALDDSRELGDPAPTLRFDKQDLHGIIEWEKFSTTEELLEATILAAASHPMRSDAPEFLANVGKAMTPEEFVQIHQSLVAAGAPRCCFDLLAAIASEAEPRGKNAITTAVPLCGLGGGQTSLFDTVLNLLRNTRQESIAAALTQPYASLALGKTLRWDPSDDRRHAHRATDPSLGDGECECRKRAKRQAKRQESATPKRDRRSAPRDFVESGNTECICGANLFALFGFTLLPAYLYRGTLHCSLQIPPHLTKPDRKFRYLLFSPALTAAEVRILLSQRCGKPRMIASSGVFAAFESQRIPNGKLRNYTAGRHVRLHQSEKAEAAKVL